MENALARADPNGAELIVPAAPHLFDAVAPEIVSGAAKTQWPDSRSLNPARLRRFVAGPPAVARWLRAAARDARRHPKPGTSPDNDSTSSPRDASSVSVPVTDSAESP